MNTERPAIIRKTARPGDVLPNWTDFEGLRSTFSWQQARRELEGLPGGGINIAHEAVDRHARGAAADRIAFKFLGESGNTTISYR